MSDHAGHDHGPVAVPATTPVAGGQSSIFGQIVVAKCLAMFVLGMGSFVLGVLPLKLAKWWRAKPSSSSSSAPSSASSSASSSGSSSASSTGHHHHHHHHHHHQHGHSHGGESAAGSPAVSLLLCFGGGVLLFTTLLHLQPEVREGVGRLQAAGRLPADVEHLGDLIFCAGFFMVFIVDEIVHSVVDRYYAAGRRSRDGDGDSAEDVLHRSMSLRRRSMSIPRASLQSGSPGSVPSVTGGASTASIKELLKESSSSGGAGGGKQKRYHHHMVHHHHHHQASPDGQVVQQYNHHHNNNTATGLHDHQRHMHHHLHADDVEKQRQHHQQTGSESSSGDGGGGGDHSLRGLFAVLALSFHEVFEGLAIGLEERVDNMWYLFVAVATHKLVIAFCIGLELAWSKTRRSVLVVYVATFAVVTPVGIAIGMALVHYGGSGSSVDGTQGVVAVVLQGLAAGTLLYVVFFEVLARHKQSGFLHLLSIMFGFAALLVLQMMTHNHSHGPVNVSGEHHDHNHDHDHGSENVSFGHGHSHGGHNHSH